MLNLISILLISQTYKKESIYDDDDNSSRIFHNFVVNILNLLMCEINENKKAEEKKYESILEEAYMKSKNDPFVKSKQWLDSPWKSK